MCGYEVSLHRWCCSSGDNRFFASRPCPKAPFVTKAYSLTVLHLGKQAQRDKDILRIESGLPVPGLVLILMLAGGGGHLFSPPPRQSFSV